MSDPWGTRATEGSLPATVDVIVVGGGTAGCVLAGRLTELDDRSVLVLEAGPDYGPRSSTSWPGELKDAATIPVTHDWGHFGKGAAGQDLAFERARVIGGCSTHNGCTQSWGWAGDYDRWAASGLGGWSAASMKDYFAMATERMRVRRSAESEVQPFHEEFLGACARLGIPRTSDLDDLDGGLGVDVSPVNIVDGVRWNAAFAYLDPVRQSSRLRVVGGAEVTSIHVAQGRVVGVDVVREQGSVEHVACGELILSSGTYGTPDLLLRSGIGPAPELQALGMAVVLDLPGVGRNLHDQSTLQLEFDASPELVSRLEAFRAAHDNWLPEEQTVAKLASSVAQAPYDLHVYPWVEPRTDSPTGWVAVMPVGLLMPLSRGRYTLAKSHGQVRGIVEHNYLGEPADLNALLDGVDIVEELVQSSGFARLLGRRRNPRQVDESARDWARRTHTHYWHPAGTAAMGKLENGGVLDGNGRLHGLENLVVVDASMFPEAPRSTPALPVVAAAERIAAAIAVP